MVLAIAVAALIAWLLRDRQQSVWTSIGMQPAIAISGLARIDGSNGLELLVVHDNRLPGEIRLGRLRVEDAAHEPVTWPGDDLPIDLEAVSPIPGRPGLFLTITSGGDASLVQLTGGGADLLGAFTLPERPQRPQFEGLSVQRLGDMLVAAWGDRGAGNQPGHLYWGVFDLEAPGMTVAGSVEMRAPYPPPGNATTRHISDLRIARDGRLWLSSASDPGDRGPFQSAVYEAGRFVVTGGAIRFEPCPSPTPAQTYRRKIEAIELTADESQLVLGTDDEASGGAITILPLD